MKDRHEGDAEAALPFGTLRVLFDNLGLISYYLNAVVLPLAERHDLGPRGIWVLRFIADGDIYPTEIAASMMVAASLITNDVQRLIKAGLIAREPDAADGRRTRLSLRPSGRALLREAYELYEARVGRRLRSYDPGELGTFFKVLAELGTERWQSLEPGSNELGRVESIRRLENENRELKATIKAYERLGANQACK